ncbi:DUF2291 family protein [Pseudozobellia thermophila]|uniref:DUF2291 family protein n=1 Tax=Pseudozobellia thermophila TaxID=192903 RepID=UPI00147EABC8|nr:DUF2291 family protein [Pseudozobellia thermophila]
MLKNFALIGVLAIALYNSVYFKPLDEVVSARNSLDFDPALVARNFVDKGLSEVGTTHVSELLAQLKTDLEATLEEKGNKLGIGKDYYFMVEGKAQVLDILEEEVVVGLDNAAADKIYIATDFIFGNAIREASGVFDIGDYQNTMDFNNISIELNNIVREEVIPPFLKNIKQGDHVYFKGAVKVNKKNPNLDRMRVVPLVLKIN